MKNREVEGKSFQANWRSSLSLTIICFFFYLRSTKTTNAVYHEYHWAGSLKKIRSIQENIDEFQVILTQLKYLPSIICCTETWLSPNQNFGISKIKEYQLLIERSRKRRGGGVCFYIKFGINYKRIERTSCNNIQLLSVKNRKWKVKKCNYYVCLYYS